MLQMFYLLLIQHIQNHAKEQKNLNVLWHCLTKRGGVQGGTTVPITLEAMTIMCQSWNQRKLE